MKTDINKWTVVPTMRTHDEDSRVSDYTEIEYEGVKVAVGIKVAASVWRVLLMSNVNMNWQPWTWGGDNCTPLSDEYNRFPEALTALRERYEYVIADRYS